MKRVNTQILTVLATLIILPATVDAQRPSMGNYKAEAVKVFQEAQIIHRNLWSVEDLKRTVEKYQQAFHIFERIQADRDKATTLNAMGDAFSAFARMSDALASLQKSLEISTRTGDTVGQSVTLAKIGLAYQRSGNYSKALEYYEKALNLRRKTGEDVRCGGLPPETFEELFQQKGAYAAQMVCLDRFMEIARDLADASIEQETLVSRGWVLSNMGMERAGLQAFEKSLEISREIGDERAEFSTMMLMAMAYEMSGQFERCLELIQKLQEIQDGKSRPLWNRNDLNDRIANLYLSMGKIGEAEATVGTGSNWFVLGRLAIAKGDWAQAKLQFEKALPWAIKERGMWAMAIYSGLGLAYEGSQDYWKAEQYFRQAIELTEETRDSLEEPLRIGFLGVVIHGISRVNPYEGLSRVLIRQGRNGESLETSEATKARCFVEALCQGAPSLGSSIPSQLIDEDLRLTDRLVELRKKLRTALKEGLKHKIEYFERQVREVQEELSRHIRKLRMEYPLFAATRYPQPMDLSQTALRPEEWVLEYDVTDSGILIYLTRGKELMKGLFKAIPRKEVDELVRKYREPLEVIPGKDNLEDKLKAFDFRSGKKLVDLLLSDVLPMLPEKVPVIVVPDDSLGIVPFEMLVLNQGGQIKTDSKIPCTSGAQFFGDRNPLSYSQSITALTLARTLVKTKGMGDQLLVMADPVYKLHDERAQQSGSPKVASGAENYYTNVMAAMEESRGGISSDRLPLTGGLAERLGGMFPAKAAVYTGLAATKGNFLSKIAPDLKPYRSIVFAAHGYVGTRIPGVMEPVLVLTTVPPGTDGLLRMSEIMGLRMNADVVALTACQTGLGQRISGEGTMGMGRAFQYAGAKSVLMSLWSVAEKSSVDLVESFFRNVKEGKNKLEALKLARDDIRKAGYDHPFFWAPFILVGETD